MEKIGQKDLLKEGGTMFITKAIIFKITTTLVMTAAPETTPAANFVALFKNNPA
jgi:hypothetical protein